MLVFLLHSMKLLFTKPIPPNPAPSKIIPIISETLYIYLIGFHNSSANREQLKDACKILGSILPVMLSIIQKNADKDWGKPFYPFVKED